MKYHKCRWNTTVFWFYFKSVRMIMVIVCFTRNTPPTARITPKTIIMERKEECGNILGNWSEFSHISLSSPAYEIKSSFLPHIFTFHSWTILVSLHIPVNGYIFPSNCFHQICTVYIKTVFNEKSPKNYIFSSLWILKALTLRKGTFPRGVYIINKNKFYEASSDPSLIPIFW